MKPEIVLALASTAIALTALVVSVYQVRRARIAHELSNLPMLRVSLGTEEGGLLSFSFHNEGNGACFIENVALTVDGKPVELHMLLTKLFGEGSQFVSTRLAHQFPKVVQAQQREEIFRLAETGENPRTDVQLMHEFATRVGIRIESRALSVDDERNVIDIARFANPSEQGFRAK